MTKNKVIEILKAEGLKHYNWFGNHDVKPDEVLIYKEHDNWIVCAADERACIVETSYAFYDNEEMALEDFVKRVRLEKILMNG